MAKGIAWAGGKPFLAVNHLEAHALSVRLDRAPWHFPICCCWSPAAIASCSPAPGSAVTRRLGTTLDDAAGEAFDKTAKLIGLGYPGGPAIEQAAARRRRAAILPAAPAGRPARLRLFVLRAQDGGAPDRARMRAARGPQIRRDLAASVELAICDALCDRTANAIAWFRAAPSGGQEPRGRRRGRPPTPGCGERLAGLGRGRPASTLWRRRRPCAPTMRR